MDKAFDPGRIEGRWREAWDESGAFRANPSSGKPPFCMVIPPPNITGRLHVGHGLNNTLQDLLARWKRMSGHDVLWLPGSDHASIGTHVMIERELEKEGVTRQELGRERFIEKAWAWKEKYGGEIAAQLRQLGASCDWSRERFTMDPGLSAAVREVFVSLYEDGLIYRDRYLINWCPRCRTAVSDLEVVHKETQGKIWTVAYPLEGGGEILVATTRPETILGDVAVAVHPDDALYKPLVGRKAILPVLGRRIDVVADAFVDPAYGTGAVKVTPAHDPNDFMAGRRLGLEPIAVMDEQARMNEAAGPYAGMDRFECRARLLERLREEGLLREEKDHTLSLGRCQRCDTIVEPLISLQWFVRIAPLAAPALEAVESGRIAFVPDMWRKTYSEWMRNIRDWCISRQLWWGHRIPAWYCTACNTTLVLREDPASCRQCGSGSLVQDPDILDTWFSSGLWAFSTMGWPQRTEELRRYYPNSVLVTGYDIIFFWVARMIMLGMRFMGDVPFPTVLYNGLVRDEHGQKMSKMRGNAVDLFDLMAKYGTDAVRFTCTSMSAPGADIALAPGRLDGSRAFANKIWNAVRFAKPHLPGGPLPDLPSKDSLSLADRWILSRSSRLAAEVTTALEQYRFDAASSAIYQFAWHELCDWYLELIKPELFADEARSGGPAGGSRIVLGHVLDRLVRLLHPMMPFLTEELHAQIPQPAGRARLVAQAPWPAPEPAWEDAEAERALAVLMETVSVARNLKASLGLSAPGIPLSLVPAGAAARRDLERLLPAIQALTRSGPTDVLASLPEGIAAVRGVTSSGTVALHVAGYLDVDKERDRLSREMQRLRKELDGHAAKLANADFLARAKPEAKEKATRAHHEVADKLDKLKSVLDQLAG